MGDRWRALEGAKGEESGWQNLTTIVRAMTIAEPREVASGERSARPTKSRGGKFTWDYVPLHHIHRGYNVTIGLPMRSLIREMFCFYTCLDWHLQNILGWDILHLPSMAVSFLANSMSFWCI